MDKIMITRDGIRKLLSYKDSTRGNSMDGDLSSVYAGCTANVALLYKNELYVANAGDSRSVLCANS
jgi:protein phosphatase 1G